MTELPLPKTDFPGKADYERREIDRSLYETLREWSEAVNRFEESKERVAVLARRLQNSYEDFMRRKARRQKDIPP